MIQTLETVNTALMLLVLLLFPMLAYFTLRLCFKVDNFNGSGSKGIPGTPGCDQPDDKCQ